MNKDIKTALIIGSVIIAIAIVVPLISGAISGGQSGGWGMMGPWMMGGYSTMFIMPILWIVFLGLIIWGVVAVVRGVSQPGGSDSASSRPDSALEILKKRYARGEINKEEYEEKKKDLV